MPRKTEPDSDVGSRAGTSRQCSRQWWVRMWLVNFTILGGRGEESASGINTKVTNHSNVESYSVHSNFLFPRKTPHLVPYLAL